MALASSWQVLLNWVEANRIGDLSGVAGILISVVGFAVTLRGVIKSKSAAQRAEEAAKSTRNSIRLLNTIVDFSAAIATLEEVKRLHRSNQWSLLPDRYAALRRILVVLRTAEITLNPDQSAVLQNALSDLSAMEEAVERFLEGSSTPKAAKFNAVISRDIDQLIAVLTELQRANSGA